MAPGQKDAFYALLLVLSGRLGDSHGNVGDVLYTI